MYQIYFPPMPKSKIPKNGEMMLTCVLTMLSFSALLSQKGLLELNPHLAKHVPSVMSDSRPSLRLEDFQPLERVLSDISLSLLVRSRWVRCCGPHDPPPFSPVFCCSDSLSQTQSCYLGDVLEPRCRGAASPSTSVYFACDYLFI